MKKYVVFFGITTVGAMLALFCHLYDINFVKQEVTDKGTVVLMMLIVYAIINIAAFGWAVDRYEEELDV